MEEEGIQQSRLFVILAVALIGVLVLGLLGIGGVFVIRQNLQEQAALSRPTPTVMIRLPEPSATFTPVKPAATSTPAPTPTNTPVLEEDGDKPSGAPAAVGGGNNGGEAQAISGIPLPDSTNGVPGASAAEVPSTVPDTGLGGLEAVLIALGLAGVLFVARRMRMSTR